jgi:hypothetical protein
VLDETFNGRSKNTRGDRADSAPAATGFGDLAGRSIAKADPVAEDAYGRDNYPGRSCVDRTRSVSMKEEDRLDRPATAAAKVLEHLAREDFGNDPVADVRDPA